MTSYYEVLRPVTPADLDAPSSIAEVMKLIPQSGTVTFEAFRHLGKDRATRGLGHARKVGVLGRISPNDRIMNLESVKFWLTQFNKSGFKNLASPSGTALAYVRLLAKFDEWLSGRPFRLREKRAPDCQAAQKSFANVEDLKEYCDEYDYDPRLVKRIMREYLTSPQVAAMSGVIYSHTRSAIKSYFGAHDIEINMPKTRRRHPEEIQDDFAMTLENAYKMLQNGRPSVMMRAIILIKLQSGMDAATLADRFKLRGVPAAGKML